MSSAASYDRGLRICGRCRHASFPQASRSDEDIGNCGHPWRLRQRGLFGDHRPRVRHGDTCVLFQRWPEHELG